MCVCVSVCLVASPMLKLLLKCRASRSNAKQVYVGALFRAFLGYVGSCWLSWAPCWLILALFGPILSPSCRKMAPKWPNIDQHSAKMGQNCFPRVPKSPKNLKQCIKTQIVFEGFVLSGFSLPRFQKVGKMLPKMVSSWSSWVVR